MKNRRIDARLSIPLAMLLAAGLSAGCGGESGTTEVEPGAPRAAHDREIPGMNSEDDLDPITAQRYIDGVRIGHDIDANGQVPDSQESDTFDPESAVHVSMEATDAPAGSVVRLNVLEDATDRRVWTEELEVPAGRSYVNFTIDGGELDSGAYRAEIVIGDETVADRDFSIRDSRA